MLRRCYLEWMEASQHKDAGRIMMRAGSSRAGAIFIDFKAQQRLPERGLIKAALQGRTSCHVMTLISFMLCAIPDSGKAISSSSACALKRRESLSGHSPSAAHGVFEIWLSRKQTDSNQTKFIQRPKDATVLRKCIWGPKVTISNFYTWVGR